MAMSICPRPHFRTFSTPFPYAARWNEPLRGDRAAYAAAVDRWLAYYEREGVTAIGIGAVVLRKRDGVNRGAGLDLQGPSSGNAGRFKA